MSFTNGDERIIAKGLEDYTTEEFSQLILDFLYEKVDYVDSDFNIVQLSVVGSRLKGSHRENSDLDVAFLYEGRYRSDSMCDTLNMDPLVIDDIKIDFVPYAIYKGDRINNNHAIQDLPILN